MVEGEPAAGTFGSVLSERRRQAFVGRTAELEAFREALSGPARVLSVHGPGGIGKTSLLLRYVDLAADLGVAVTRLDGRELEPSPKAVLECLGAATVDDVRRVVPEPAVLMVDTYEELQLLDDWFRTTLLPRLPLGVVTVLAGREPLDAAWRADPGWRDVLRVVPLRNLTRGECGAYLLTRGLDPERDVRAVEISHGHPLGLAVLADLVASGGEVDDPLTPDVVATLLHSFVDVLPTGPRRTALEVCAVARTTNEALLRDVLGVDDAHEIFDWLRGLSFVEPGPDGLAPHDLAREVLVADLRWRDPQAYDAIFRRIQEHILGLLGTTTGRRRQRALYDAKYLHRHQQVSRGWTDWDSFGRHYPESARPADGAELVELIRGWEGAESAAIARHWWQLQPEGFLVVRHHDGRIRGVIATIDLTLAAEADIAADPGAAAALRYTRSNLRRRPDDRVTLVRFCVDREAYQDPSPTTNLGPVVAIQHWLETPRLAASLLAFHEPERRQEFFTFFEIPRAVGADFEVGGRRYGMFVRDFHRLPLDRWLRVMFERDLAGDPGPPDRRTAEPLLLSEPDFAQAVRAALRDLPHRDALARNPLTRSPLVLAKAGDPASQLADLVRRTVERLAANEREHKLYRALDRTYVRPAATQERAAELLGLPLSTYKRHLARGVDRVIADLWRQELDESEPETAW
ncbi:hypothetical protein [Kribbella sp. HUAS MG21]|uniref:ATP-binding protein n=1 Tax=Kribbella sp. HUAS MG21 TaxID=3160966 RepID=A0AAU7TC87_9ACTN